MQSKDSVNKIPHTLKEVKASLFLEFNEPLVLTLTVFQALHAPTSSPFFNSTYLWNAVQMEANKVLSLPMLPVHSHVHIHTFI